MLDDSAASLQGGLPIRKNLPFLVFFGCFLDRICCTAVYFVKNGVDAAFTRLVCEDSLILSIIAGNF